MQSVVLKILSQCNWKCGYCDNHKDEISDINKVKKYIHLFQEYNPDILMSFTGGEPGLLPKEYLEELFYTLNKPCEIATNGTFLKNGYHLIFSKHINNISYHVTPFITKDLKLNNIIFSDILTQYIIVIHQKNIGELIPFLELNKNIDFNLKFYVGNDPDYILSLQKLKNLYDTGILDMNIDDNSKDKIRLFKFINSKKLCEYQKTCKKSIFVPRIDLINNIIYRCCAGNTNNIDSSPLTDLTLKLMFKHNTFPCKKTDPCDNCFHNFLLIIDNI